MTRSPLLLYIAYKEVTSCLSATSLYEVHTHPPSLGKIRLLRKDPPSLGSPHTANGVPPAFKHREDTHVAEAPPSLKDSFSQLYETQQWPQLLEPLKPTLYSAPIAAFLDKHRNQVSGLPPHLRRALASLSYDLASVAQRHFNAFISGISVPGQPEPARPPLPDQPGPAPSHTPGRPARPGASRRTHQSQAP